MEVRRLDCGGCHLQGAARVVLSLSGISAEGETEAPPGMAARVAYRARFQSRQHAHVPGGEPYNRVDTWSGDGNGLVFGGTSDGYLFRLKPKTLEARQSQRGAEPIPHPRDPVRAEREIPRGWRA
jgi:hypothetical protein